MAVQLTTNGDTEPPPPRGTDNSRRRYAEFLHRWRTAPETIEAKDKPSDPTTEPERSPGARATARQRYRQWLWPRRRAIASTLLLGIVGIVIDLIWPVVSCHLFDNVILGDHAPADRRRELVLWSVAMLALYLLSSVLGYVRNLQSTLLFAHLAFDLRGRLYGRILRLPLDEVYALKTGGVISRLSNDVDSTTGLLHQAMTRISEQADRAGRVIKSVHAFVRRREQQHETIAVDQLFEAVMPLVRLQAHKSGVRVALDLPGVVSREGEPMPRVRCDRTMVEQVLLNLSRNGIQAMDAVPDLSQRVLTLGARRTHERWVTFSVSDAGTGITPEVAAKLFTPFFSTRGEGMGLGLSLCRTVIEQHGGVLDFGPGPGKRGTEFRFTLPTPRPPPERPAPAVPRADSY